MALLFFDGCQWGASGTNDAGWDAGSGPITYQAGTGPFSDRVISNLGNPVKTFGSNVTTIILGYWWYQNAALAALSHFDGRDTTNVQFRLAQDATGHLTIRNGTAGTILGTSTTGFSHSVWRWVEWKIPLGNSVTVVCKVDGATEINVSTVDTTTTANAYITNVIASTGNTSGIRYNCIHMCDTTGSSQNDFLGPQRAQLCTPTGSDTGNFNQWTASTSTRTSCVDETPTTNDDTDYVSDSTAGHQQSFTMTDLAVSPGVINGVSLHGRMRRDDAGPRTARLFLRASGGTVQNEATETLAATYVTYTYQRGTSPFTSSAWSESEVNGLEAGAELVS